MTLTEKINKATSDYQLLKHPFYQDWNEGKLSLEVLKEYAGQYYFHVDAFPRYISATHSLCNNIEDRKILLENLTEEDGLNAEAHIDLWTAFCEALGHKKENLESTKVFKSIEKLTETFFKQARTSYEVGLASLYAYEKQVPEVAETKIEGLKNHYGITDKKSIAFFSVHKLADVHHRESCEKLLNKIPMEIHDECVNAAVESSKALWDFLTEAHQLQLAS